MASNIIPIQATGVGAEAARLDEIVLDANGNPPSFEQLESQFGDMQAFLILLEHNMGRRLAVPRTRGYPPRVFISYRRESTEHIAWCMRLADALAGMGYTPLLDERTFRKGSMEELASFISTMVEADICLVVSTAEYAGDSRSMRNWLFEEWERIKLLDAWGSTEVVIVDRDGSAPRLMGIGTIPLNWGIIDISAEPDGIASVAGYFGRYEGIVMTPEDQREVSGLLGGLLLSLSQRSVDAAEIEHANRVLDKLDRWSSTEEHRLARAMVLLKSGNHMDALSVARELLSGDVTIPNATWLLIELWQADLELAVFPYIAELAEEPSLRRNMLHSVLAAIFEDHGADLTAAGHCSWCIGAVVDDDLRGMWAFAGGPAAYSATQASTIWGRLGRPELMNVYDRIAAGFENAVKGDIWLRPLWQESKRLLAAVGASCPKCGALGWGPRMCIRCAAVVDESTSHCPLCEFPTVEPRNLTFCPTCHLMSDAGRALFNDREPGGRWSVLPQRSSEDRLKRGYRLQSTDVSDLGL